MATPKKKPPAKKLSPAKPPADLSDLTSETPQGGEEPPKRGRGRPAGSSNRKKEEAQDAELGLAECQQACVPIFQIASHALVKVTKTKECALLNDEIMALSNAWGAVAHKYLPAILDKYAVLFTAVVVTGGVVLRVNGSAEEVIASHAMPVDNVA